MVQYIQKNQYDTEQFDDEWIILNTADFTVTKLNQVGGFCWGLLSKPQTIDSLVSEIKKEYAAHLNEAVEKDIEEFLSDLIQYGLVEHVI